MSSGQRFRVLRGSDLSPLLAWIWGPFVPLMQQNRAAWGRLAGGLPAAHGLERDAPA